MAQAAVRVDAAGFVWDWGETVDLDRPLWAVARSAAELLASADLDRVRRCPGEGCGWLFLDTTRNRSRRWCETAGCGNRAHVRGKRQGDGQASRTTPSAGTSVRRRRHPTATLLGQ
jgi:predicted RNA-binding Zn ribbon-like protein